MTLNPLASANSRRPHCFRCLGEIRCSLVSSWPGSPAAVAERDRWVKELLYETDSTFVE